MITTDRLVLRRWQDSDRAPFAALNRDPEVMRHFPAPLTQAQSDALADRCDAAIAAAGCGLWAVADRAGQFIGFTGLAQITFASPIQNDIEIGWRLARAAWGQGLAHEAASAALAHGWRHLSAPRIVSMTVAANTRSWALMERLGLARRPDLDFDHPNIPAGHPLRPHIVYAVDHPETMP